MGLSKIYFAIFARDGDWWSVRFPDAESVNTQGKDVPEALAMATDALSAMFAVGRKGRECQDPRPYEEVVELAEEGEEVFPVTVDEKIMESYKPKKRVQLKVPADLLDQADEYVSSQPGLDRSAFFSEQVAAFFAKSS